MAQLAAPFADLAVLGEDAIHGPDRAQIDALVEQAGVDFGGRQIDEARPPQHLEDGLLLGVGQRPRGLWTRQRWRRRLFACELAAMQAGARKPQRRAGCGDQPAARRQSRHGVHQEPSSFTIGSPRSAATFFWISMIASARSSRIVRSRLSRCN